MPDEDRLEAGSAHGREVPGPEGVASHAGEAGDEARAYGETGTKAVAGVLEDFAAVMRQAGEELGRRERPAAARLVRDAAGGLEQASEKLGAHSVEGLVASVQSFGRAHPVAFLAGSVLAGVAVGRIARGAAEREQEGSGSAREPSAEGR